MQTVATPQAYTSLTSHRRLVARRSCRQNFKCGCAARGRQLEVDTIVVGAGIVGLCVAHSLLRNSERKTSVALVETRQPCSGATGAGQGYIWMAHRAPGSPGWQLAARSRELWRSCVMDPSAGAGFTAQGLLGSEVEWQDVGSILVAANSAESAEISERAAALRGEGLAPEVLDALGLVDVEPALFVPEGGGGLLLRSDSQINGRATAFALLAACKALGRCGTTEERFHPLMDEAATSLEPSGCSGEGGLVVMTGGTRIKARQAVVLAAGVWSGQLLSSWTGEAAWASAFQPRRGHLLEVDRPAAMPVLRHGVMELSYTQHYPTSHSTSSTATVPPAPAPHPTDPPSPLDITFTATTSAAGSLLVGSSREFGGWDTTASPDVVDAILSRATQFLPQLRSVRGSEVAVRVGLRPFARGGLPFIGPVPGVPGLLLAAGHEGSGLTLGPATAELVCRYIHKQSRDLQDEEAASGWEQEFLPATRIKMI